MCRENPLCMAQRSRWHHPQRRWSGWLDWWRSRALGMKASLHGPFDPSLFGRPISRGEIGLLGEHLAVKWLRVHGRRVLFRNFRGPHRGEVDIVCRHGEVLTFVEVKTRTSDAFGRPADAVTLDKERLIRRGASEWLRLLGHPPIRFRFDIVEVLLVRGERPKINVIENAFGMPGNSTEGR